MNESLEDIETKSSEYRCSKCRDLTFIVDDAEANECECRQLRESEDILKKSGISEEFRNKRFSNFVYGKER